MAWYWPFKRQQESEFDRPVVLRRIERTLAEHIRRFELGDTRDSDKAKWCGQDSRSINQILSQQLRVIHERCAYEVRNNAIVDGTIGTHSRDVVGVNGPGIQIEASSDSWAQAAERVLRDWIDQVTADGRGSLGDWLRDDIRDLWQIGDMMAQVVEPDWVQDGLRTRVHQIDGRGLTYNPTGKNNILGIERDKYRRPINYYVTEVEDQWGLRSVTPKTIPARDMMHDYIAFERGQVRGFPLMTVSLPVLANLREYDSIVMRAAKVQALLSVFMQAIDETIPPEENPAAIEIVDQGITRVPNGFTTNTLTPTQPMANNTEYRSERMRELGSPVGMPLMKLKNDSSRHNYSSARFDAGSYNRACQVLQGWLFRRRVKPLLTIVLREAMLRGMLPVRSLQRITIHDTWDQPPHADPVKEAMAGLIRLNSRQSSPITEARAHGNDFEQLCREWRRANETLVANGMPPMLGPIGGQLTDLNYWINGEQADGQSNNQNA